MKVTDEMLEKATVVIADFGVPDDEAGGLAFEVLGAVLADVPEPNMQEAALRGCGNVIRALEAKLRKIQDAALASALPACCRIDRIQDVLSGKAGERAKEGR